MRHSPIYILTVLSPLLSLSQSNDKPAEQCGKAFYYPSKYTCYENSFLCPVVEGELTLKCGQDCYLPRLYDCNNETLTSRPTSSSHGLATTTSTSPPMSSTESTCIGTASTLHLSDPPYENYFYSDCHSSSQVVVTSPLSDSNLTVIGPRLLIAWPAGNSGIVTFFEPANGINGSLGIELIHVSNSSALSGYYEPGHSTNPVVGISGMLNLNSSCIMTVAILGSIRTIRDFTEGPSILVPEIQLAVRHDLGPNGSFVTSRVWLDNVTQTMLSMMPQTELVSVSDNNGSILFAAGSYNFTASFDYPQLHQLSSLEVLNPASQQLISQQSDQVSSLSFLSYTDKLLAGAWRFLTYFGRDSMISLLLLQPVLSEGPSGAIEAVIGAVLERINSTDGSVCHEETLGDYATYLNKQNNVSSTDPTYDYKMIDSDYYLSVVMQKYFLDTAIGRDRTSSFFEQEATVSPANEGLRYADLAMINAEKIMNTSAPFAEPGGQTAENLIHLKEGQIVGEWRDSTYGIGGGRIPYDVNTALVPAALRSIAALSASGFYPTHPGWASLATTYAQVWEDATLAFFTVTVQAEEARSLVENYSRDAGYEIASQSALITDDITYRALALEGNNNQSVVKVMNTDDCFRLFFLNTTEQTQLTALMNSSANNILAPFPIGLSTPVGLLVANPAYGGDEVYVRNFTNAAYHGTVVWSWQLAMMAKGLERQLGRCSEEADAPEFCEEEVVYSNVRAAYNHLWDLIEANEAHLSSEVWSWVFKAGKYVFTPLGALPPPDGSSPTESDIRQLWSLTFLAVKRNDGLR